MPELPEVEVLVRHLAPLLINQTVRRVEVRRVKVLAPTSARQLRTILRAATFVGLSRRGKYLLFALRRAGRRAPTLLLGHLGMTGRMYLLPSNRPLPKHTSVALQLGQQRLVFEDTRYFGRFTLDLKALARLGPEPLDGGFTPDHLARALGRSTQPIKVKLLDQSVAAGLGNIYASEALFRAGISPSLPARALSPARVKRLWRAVRAVLAEAIACGSTVPLNFAGKAKRDGLFYFGRAPGAPDYYAERLLVYDREGRPCANCGRRIRRLLQAGRSTFYCPGCQRG